MQFKLLAPGQIFNKVAKDIDVTFAKLHTPRPHSRDCDGCDTPKEKIWNATNFHNDVHFCSGIEVKGTEFFTSIGFGKS